MKYFFDYLGLPGGVDLVEDQALAFIAKAEADQNYVEESIVGYFDYLKGSESKSMNWPCDSKAHVPADQVLLRNAQTRQVGELEDNKTRLSKRQDCLK